jgi:hypothetical protein
MPCVEAEPGVVVCRAGVKEILRRIEYCPTCKRRRRVVDVTPENPYVAPWMTCLACGDSWDLEGLHTRPSEPGWREKARARAREYWNNPFTMTPEQEAEWMRRWFGIEVDPAELRKVKRAVPR